MLLSSSYDSNETGSEKSSMTKHIDGSIQHRSIEHSMNLGHCSHQFKTQYKETERNSTNMLRYFITYSANRSYLKST